MSHQACCESSKSDKKCHKKAQKEQLEVIKCKQDKCYEDDQIYIFDHKIQLQLYDYAGFPVPNTQFWITLTIRKQGPYIVIQLPAINFQTGQLANNSAEQTAFADFGYFVLINGGYIYTSDGFCPVN